MMATPDKKALTVATGEKRNSKANFPRSTRADQADNNKNTKVGRNALVSNSLPYR